MWPVVSQTQCSEYVGICWRYTCGSSWLLPGCSTYRHACICRTGRCYWCCTNSLEFVAIKTCSCLVDILKYGIIETKRGKLTAILSNGCGVSFTKHFFFQHNPAGMAVAVLRRCLFARSQLCKMIIARSASSSAFAVPQLVAPLTDTLPLVSPKMSTAAFWMKNFYKNPAKACGEFRNVLQELAVQPVQQVWTVSAQIDTHVHIYKCI